MYINYKEEINELIGKIDNGSKKRAKYTKVELIRRISKKIGNKDLSNSS